MGQYMQIGIATGIYIRKKLIESIVNPLKYALFVTLYG